MSEDITVFIRSTNQLEDWLNTAERKIKEFKGVGTHPDEIDQQSEELSVILNAHHNLNFNYIRVNIIFQNFVINIAEQGELVSNVVKISRQLCANTSGNAR